VHVERRLLVALLAASITVAGGCSSGTIDSQNAPPSGALITEGAKAIVKVCKTSERVSMRVQYSGRRPNEQLEYRLRSRTVGRAAPQYRSAHVVLYDYGTGLVNERARDEQPYCPRP
jgi:hypothetical protein